MMGFDCYIVTLDTFRGRDNDGGGRGFDRYEPARERGGFGGFSRDRNDRGNQNFSVVAVCLLTFVCNNFTLIFLRGYIFLFHSPCKLLG